MSLSALIRAGLLAAPAAALAAAPVLAAPTPAAQATPAQDASKVAPKPAAKGLDKISHVVVIYLENHSFDNMFGHFPGANGLDQAGNATLQNDKDGKPYATLPPVIMTDKKPPEADPRFPKDLANKPFLIDQYVTQDQKIPDLIHRFYTNQKQINGGKGDEYVAYSDAGALVMGYYDLHNTALYRYAQEFTLADNYFQAAFGGSFLNHFWLVCACTPTFPNAPEGMRAVIEGDKLVKDGAVTTDGYAVNTVLSSFSPHPANAKPENLLPPQTMPHIGDRLDQKHVSWAWYSGGFNDALAGKPDVNFQFHHQPLAYFADLGDGTKGRAKHLKDETDLMKDIAANKLPSVTFYKPIGDENEHPGYANMSSGDSKLQRVVQAIRMSPAWQNTAIIITVDEFGGFYDHVAPPKGDRWGPGTRIPALVVSPYAKKGFVDHTFYDTTSILKLIETRYRLKPLGERDAKAGDLRNAFDFTQKVVAISDVKKAKVAPVKADAPKADAAKPAEKK